MSPWLSDLFLRSQSDERLVGLASAGFDRAFVAIVERYKRRLLAFARRLGMADRAEDVVQQAFLSAFASISSGAEVEHLSGWLHQIVRNSAIRISSRTLEEAELLEDSIVAESVEDEVERRLQVEHTLVEIAGLPERQRAALVLTAVQGQSRNEAAVSMGLSEGAVRQLVHRARTSLRAAATALTPYPLASWAAGSGAADPSVAATSRIAEITIGAGSAGGLAVKSGLIALASGVLATGIAVAPGRHQRAAHAHRAPVQTAARVTHAQLARAAVAAANPVGVSPARAHAAIGRAPATPKPSSSSALTSTGADRIGVRSVIPRDAGGSRSSQGGRSSTDSSHQGQQRTSTSSSTSTNESSQPSATSGQPHDGAGSSSGGETSATTAAAPLSSTEPQSSTGD